MSNNVIPPDAPLVPGLDRGVVIFGYISYIGSSYIDMSDVVHVIGLPMVSFASNIIDLLLMAEVVSEHMEGGRRCSGYERNSLT